MVVKRNGRWCVIHSHPRKPGSKTDKPKGAIIHCYSGGEEGHKKAQKMHVAILISQGKIHPGG